MKTFFNRLGPGLIMAAAAIGVSHLVQSTRAGADFGYALMGLVIVTNLLKYPFFEAGHRYTVATNESLICGYRRLGRPYCLMFLLLSLLTSVGSIAAVSFVTAAVLQYLSPVSISLPFAALAVLFSCSLVLWWGEYPLLDRFVKLLMSLLLISTLAALVMALIDGGGVVSNAVNSPWQLRHLPFLIALMGWMPAPIELSAWQSLWILAKNRSQNLKMTSKEGQIDFNVGYLLTLVTALFFLVLGALMLQGNSSLGGTPVGFIEQLIEAYAKNLGPWSRPIVGLSAFACMFSTSLTLIDAYPRSVTEALSEWLLIRPSPMTQRRIYVLSLFAMLISAFIVIAIFQNQLKGLIDFVTILAFLAAPLFAFLNLRLLRSRHTPLQARPGFALDRWSEVGLVFLMVFAFIYLFLG